MSYPVDDHGSNAQATRERQERPARPRGINDPVSPVALIDPTNPLLYAQNPNYNKPYIPPWNQDTNGAGFPAMEPRMDHREIAHQAEAEGWRYRFLALSDLHPGAQEAYNSLPMSQPITADELYRELQAHTKYTVHNVMDGTEVSEPHDMALQDAEVSPDEPMYDKEAWNEEYMTENWYRCFSKNPLALLRLDDGAQWHYNRAHFRATWPRKDYTRPELNLTKGEYIQIASEPSNLNPKVYAAGFASVSREPDGGWELNNPTLTNDIRAKDLVDPPGLRRIQGNPEAAASPTGIYHVLASWATPERVNISLIGGTPITAAELLTFFPNHVRWSGFADRFANQTDGFTKNHLGAFIMSARNITAEKIFRNHISFLTKHWKKIEENEQGFQNRSKKIEHHVMEWSPPKYLRRPQIVPIDYHVRDLAAGVPRANFPSKADKGPLTYTIEHALDYEAYSDLKLSNVERFSEARRGALNGSATMSFGRTRIRTARRIAGTNIV